MKIVLILLTLFCTKVFAEDASSLLGQIPVQDAGRIKPFDTFAKESLQLIYGKKTYKSEGANQKVAASEIIFTWMLFPDEWNNTHFVQVENLNLKKQLGLDETRKLFSPAEIVSNEKLRTLMQELEAKKNAKEKLNPFFQAIDRLQNQITLFKAIGQGYVPGFYPGENSDTWVSVKDFNTEFIGTFAKITSGFAQTVKPDGDKEKGLSELRQAVQFFTERARSLDISRYPSQQIINLEIQYNNVHPFQVAWVLYLVSVVLFSLYFIYQKEAFYKSSMWMAMIAFLFHTYGFILRVVISGRPPVSNMYETVIWVPWAAVLFAFILMKVSKNRFFLLSASIISFMCLVLADLAPVVLDSSIQPLQPVLRSNLWLTVHVLTITLSYGALFLSFVLGDIALIYHLINEQKYSKQLVSLRDAIYRSIQVGVVLLGAGTILGGVWADYSWGRFWGWDPKETWALIAFLGYIAILHGRFAGWIKPFGFSVWTVIAFNLVIMAWYGVNYVLGAGLHSYGFGAGGVEFMALFTAIHIIFCSTVWFVKSQRQKATN